MLMKKVAGTRVADVDGVSSDDSDDADVDGIADADCRMM